MNQHVAPPGRLNAEQFWNFIKDRPREERWQLIDGEAFMMSPASRPHQVIGRNLARLLDDALEVSRPGLIAVQELALTVETHPDFRAVADVAVIGFEVEDIVYGEGFYLAAEVLSDSNTHEHISRKRELYAEAPDCCHVLIVSQREFCVEVWSRSHDWQGRVFRSAEDRIVLPEFGLDRRVGELHRGTPVK